MTEVDETDDRHTGPEPAANVFAAAAAAAAEPNPAVVLPAMRERLSTLIGGMETSDGPKLPMSSERGRLYGRSRELDELRRTLDVVRQEGECRAVTIVGPPGVGKTRLIDELVAQIRVLENPPVRLFRADATDKSSKWAIFTQLLSQRFTLGDTDIEQSKAELRAQVEKVLDDRKVGDVLYFLGELLDLEFPKSPLTKALDDGSSEYVLLKHAVIKTFFEADASFGPMCFLLDNLDNCHADSLGLVRFLIDNLHAPILIVSAARPEFLARDEGWAQSDSHAFLQLEPLGDIESKALIGSLLVPSGLTPMHLVEQAREVAGGNPGRIDEVARFYRDQGTLPPPPSGVDDAVRSRVERLTPGDRLILQRAALTGGVFWLGGLLVIDRAEGDPPALWNRATAASRSTLMERLAYLTEQDYILRLPESTFAGDQEFVWKHRAEREKIASFTSTTEARRWHRAVAEWLDGHAEVRSDEEYLEMLANQWERSGARDTAALVLFETAALARNNSAAKHEIIYLERALDLLGDTRMARRFDALLRLAELLERVNRREASVDRYREAIVLAFRLDRPVEALGAHIAVAAVLRKLERSSEVASHLASAEDLLEGISNAEELGSVRAAIASLKGPAAAASGATNVGRA